MYYSSYPIRVFLYAVFALWKSAEFKESVGPCVLMDVMYSLTLESSLANPLQMDGCKVLTFPSSVFEVWPWAMG